MIIRKAEKQDYSAVDEIILKLHELHVANNPDFYEPVDHVITMADYQEFIASLEHLYYIAEEDGLICGIVFASTKDIDAPGMIKQKIGYMDSVYVLPTYRRKGIGKQLFLFIEEKLALHAVQHLNLMVWQFNQDAAKFYEKVGMTEQRAIYWKKPNFKL